MNLIDTKETPPPSGGKRRRVHSADSICDAAAKMKVSVRAVERVRFITRYGIPELRQRVEDRALTITTAEMIARLPQETQREVIGMQPEELRRVAIDVRKNLFGTRILEHRLRAVLVETGASADLIDAIVALSKEPPPNGGFGQALLDRAINLHNRTEELHNASDTGRNLEGARE